MWKVLCGCMEEEIYLGLKSMPLYDRVTTAVVNFLNHRRPPSYRRPKKATAVHWVPEGTLLFLRHHESRRRFSPSMRAVVHLAASYPCTYSLVRHRTTRLAVAQIDACIYRRFKTDQASSTNNRLSLNCCLPPPAPLFSLLLLACSLRGFRVLCSS